jgi:hypothetical protein
MGSADPLGPSAAPVLNHAIFLDGEWAIHYGWFDAWHSTAGKCNNGYSEISARPISVTRLQGSHRLSPWRSNDKAGGQIE